MVVEPSDLDDSKEKANKTDEDEKVVVIFEVKSVNNFEAAEKVSLQKDSTASKDVDLCTDLQLASVVRFVEEKVVKLTEDDEARVTSDADIVAKKISDLVN